MGNTLNDPDLYRLRKLYGRDLPSIFIETGTNFGHTARWASAHFEQVHTIELSPECYDRSQELFRTLAVPDLLKIHAHLGDSAKILPQLLVGINSPVVAYLDAHWSGGLAARAEKDSPLLEELAALAAHPYPDIIICDDVRLFGQTGISGTAGSEQYPPAPYDWRGIDIRTCREALGNRAANQLVENDRLIYLTGGHDL